jgi:hypothetical protein
VIRYVMCISCMWLCVCCTDRAEGAAAGLNSTQYVERGLPPECADFLAMVMAGKDGGATMSEYFLMLEVCAPQCR